MLHLGCVARALPDTSHAPVGQRSRNNALVGGGAGAAAAGRHRRRCDRFGPRRVAVILGVSTAGLQEGELAAREQPAPAGWPPGYDYAQQEMGSAAAFLARELAAHGPRHVISTACSSGAKALASGARLLRAGLVDAVVAGGGDALSGFTIAGFGALESVSAARCNPLSAQPPRHQHRRRRGAVPDEPRARAGAAGGLGRNLGRASHVGARPERRAAPLDAMRQALAARAASRQIRSTT